MHKRHQIQLIPTKSQEIKIRRWACPDCGSVHDRDENAAKNLAKLALPGSAGEVTPDGVGEVHAAMQVTDSEAGSRINILQAWTPPQ